MIASEHKIYYGINMKQTLTIRVGKEQLKQLREIANADDRSMSAMIRRFIDAGIRGEEENLHKMRQNKTVE
jgi:predicted transcriptional regulator